MIIGRNYYESQKLYSTGDDYVDELLERAFCEGYEYAQKEFTEEKKKKSKLSSSKNNSHRGIGRDLIISGGPITAGVSYKLAKKEADKADEEGASDEEILERAKKKGTAVGAIAGGASGVVQGARYGVGSALTNGVIRAGRGALGGRLGAKKNTEERLKNRKLNDMD